MDTSSSEDDSEETSPRTIEQLIQYHKDHATHASIDPIIPMHDIEERLRLIEEIRAGVVEDQEDKSEDFQFTYFQLAHFLLCSESALRHVIEYGFYNSRLESQIRCMETLLLGMLNEGFVRDNSHRKENSPQQNQECDERIAQLERGKKNLPWKEVEEKKCLARDSYRCIFTQDESTKVFQILPFIASYGSWTLAHSVDASLYFSVVLGDEVWSELAYFVCLGSDRCDKSWNMLSLSPDLQKLWEEQFFGIQCLGILPIDGQASVIWLQFHWMPRNRLHYNHRAEVNMDSVQKMLQIVPPEDPEEDDIVEEYRTRTHHPLETGHIFSIRMGNQQALIMKRVINIRWTMARIGAISGHTRNWSHYK